MDFHLVDGRIPTVPSVYLLQFSVKENAGQFLVSIGAFEQQEEGKKRAIGKLEKRLRVKIMEEPAQTKLDFSPTPSLKESFQESSLWKRILAGLSGQWQSDGKVKVPKLRRARVRGSLEAFFETPLERQLRHSNIVEKASRLEESEDVVAFLIDQTHLADWDFRVSSAERRPEDVQALEAKLEIGPYTIELKERRHNDWDETTKYSLRFSDSSKLFPGCNLFEDDPSRHSSNLCGLNQENIATVLWNLKKEDGLGELIQSSSLSQQKTQSKGLKIFAGKLGNSVLECLLCRHQISGDLFRYKVLVRLPGARPHQGQNARARAEEFYFEIREDKIARELFEFAEAAADAQAPTEKLNIRDRSVEITPAK